MIQKHLEIIAENLHITQKQVQNTLNLLNEGATVPFISRYRKEATDSLDEVQIGEIQNHSKKLAEIEDRKKSILASIEKQGKLTGELERKILSSYNLTELEDLYLPYKIKKTTRAAKAREKGLEPLSEILMKQNVGSTEIFALKFLNDKVETVEDALSGARDIIAEQISENQTVRNAVRYEFDNNAVVCSKVIKAKEEEAEKFKDYFDYSEVLKRIPSHRMLAIRRGEAEGFLRVSILPGDERIIDKIKRLFVKGRTESSEQVSIAVEDSYKRLLEPSVENEFRGLSKEKADKEAIAVFSENLKQLLLASPLGEKRILALDPGFRTGCKMVCLDEYGNILHNETIYPHPPQNETTLAARKLTNAVNTYKIDAMAIGNGTASRETEYFVRNKVRFDRDIQVFVVSENGASIYSASPVAREEFPEYDVTVRGAISIGRRLSDPLAELVKIDPKSIGVGQYQHDVDQKELQESLDRVVEYCVNSVGVDLNTAGKYLLNYVSGLGLQLAQNIVDYRNEIGGFKSRAELKKVKRLGEKAFEQCAGFLRIRNAKNPLDNSAVHPESYKIAEKMAKDIGVEIKDLIGNSMLIKQIKPENYVSEKVGLPTLKDITAELEKPGRDPRKAAKIFEFSNEVFKPEDLREGMILPGIVTNITNFGAFVDIGVKQDGLVHISQIKEAFVSNPADVLTLHQHVKVKVISVDLPRKRIGLTMIGV
jgi:uncharacterized protein